MDDTPADWLTSHGWIPGRTTTVVEEGIKQGREHLPADLTRPGAPRILPFDGAIAAPR